MGLFVDIFGNLAFVLSIISMIFINGTTYYFWKYRKFAIFRFRWPLSYLIWCILSNLYFVSRIVYIFGEVYETYEWLDESALDIITYSLRAIGLNGSFIILFLRIWLFYYTYAYDHHTLEFRTAANSWIIRYHHNLGNEWYMLRWATIILLLISVLFCLEKTVLSEQLKFVTQVYFGLCFLVFVVLAYFIPRKHDQLGLWIETVVYFVLGLVAFVLLLAIQFVFDGHKKRVIQSFGGALLFFAINFISFYVTMIRYGGYKSLPFCKAKQSNDLDLLNEANRNEVELAKIVTHSRTYHAFRKFLADIFCVENLDFVTLVQQYRHFIEHAGSNASDAKLEKQSSSVSIRRTNTRTQEENVENLLVYDKAQGIKVIDITRLNMEFVDVPEELGKLKTIKEWMHWIHHNYITNESDHCLNLPSKMRKRYVTKFEEVMSDDSLWQNVEKAMDGRTDTTEAAVAGKQLKQDTEMVELEVETKETDDNHDDKDVAGTEMEKENEKEVLSKFFDEAQVEIWKLMTKDSMQHFRNSDLYSQTMWQDTPAEI